MNKVPPETGSVIENLGFLNQVNSGSLWGIFAFYGVLMFLLIMAKRIPKRSVESVGKLKIQAELCIGRNARLFEVAGDSGSALVLISDRGVALSLLPEVPSTLPEVPSMQATGTFERSSVIQQERGAA